MIPERVKVLVPSFTIEPAIPEITPENEAFALPDMFNVFVPSSTDPFPKNGTTIVVLEIFATLKVPETVKIPLVLMVPDPDKARVVAG